MPKLFNDKYKRDPDGEAIDNMMMMAHDRRGKFERRWYENNFFDDGYHFRYISRTTGRIVDLSSRSVGNVPVRAIPKASRQIRGIANLLTNPDYVPVIYPEKVIRENYPNTPEGEAMYIMTKSEAKRQSRRIGDWLTEEWRQQEIKDKLVEMLILAAKHGVSYMQIWPDAVDEKINTMVYDAFDIYLLGDLQDIQFSPFLIKAMPETIDRIKANELFDEEKKEMLSPDNKYANSELKEAYKRATFGKATSEEQAQTILLKEAFIKTFLSEKNKEEIESVSPEVLEDKKIGDIVMRHAFSAGGVCLRNEYLKIENYPFVDLRLEPGPIYQTALIERFIPMNKSLDIAVSRVERYINTMVSGHWLKRRGEDLKISNIPGGVVYEYENTPPVQGNIQPLPAAVDNYISRLESFIDEQGAPTAALGQLPQGVKSGVAIESVKETEFMNLTIAANQLKKTVKEIAQMFIQNAAEHFINPQTVERLEQGEPDYFDIVGEAGVELAEDIEEPIPADTVVIGRDTPVDIEVETGAGFTRQGKREAAQQMANYVLQLAEAQAVPQEFVTLTVMKVMEMFGFGNTQEIAEALDKPLAQMEEQQGETVLQDQDTDKIKIAVAEVLRDLGVAGTPQPQQVPQGAL